MGCNGDAINSLELSPNKISDNKQTIFEVQSAK
jgi:hypothetical protein